MIITVTLNPALDKTAEIELLKIGQLNRLTNVLTDAGGKGINVSKMIASLGGKSVAAGFIGGKTGEEIIAKINELNIETDFISINGNTRTNLKVIDSGSRLTELNEQGPLISKDDILRLTDKMASLAKDGNIFVFAGSLPKGIEPDIYARLIKAVHKNGAIAFLDADGEAFKAALGEKPDFIKPNLHELKEYFSVKEEIDIEKTAELCVRFLERGIKTMALTMGAQGALFLNGKEILFAKGLKVEAKSSVGAGDSFVGAYAFALEQKLSWKESMILATAASAGAVMTQGTKPPSRETVEELKKQVEIQKIGG
ncbi:MAG: 1-phosphofructokinase [Elusimicrobiota bacterium]|jgi:1-phosphofructokinase|nr:1-phosphofructokinase [Elusimicrobiota bacterium]